VTSLANDGPGTLREACESAGPRIVVFNVAGIIKLTRPLDVRAPYLTIAGQTAPGDGICVTNCSTLIDTHDVVIRYMRFRRGATDVYDRDDSLGGNPIGNIIVDHCSASWGFDENLSMYRHMYNQGAGKPELKLPTVNITIQWSISSEALDTHNHAFGGTWGGFNTAFHHNLFACNTGRNASIGMGHDFNFVNNVLFNWRHRTLDGGDETSLVNCINNYYKPGPITNAGPLQYRIGQPTGRAVAKNDPTRLYGKWYVAGNVVDGNEAVTADNWAGGVQFNDGTVSEDAAPLENGAPVSSGNIAPGSDKFRTLEAKVRSDRPFPMPPIAVQSAKEAYEAVLAFAGASLPRRDAVDERIIQQVRSGKPTYTAGKGIITDINQVGGYPEYKGEPRKCSQADGIPDEWKSRYRLDISDASLAIKDVSGSGYSVIECYINGLDPNRKVDFKDPKNNVSPLMEASK
jgi:hypothetical protein